MPSDAVIGDGRIRTRDPRHTRQPRWPTRSGLTRQSESEETLHTDIGDYLFLRPLGHQEWAVCVWYQEGEWHESDLTFREWLQREVRGVDGACNILKFRDVPPRYLPVA